MTTVIAVANQAGSAGKTALVVNLAALLAKLTNRPVRVADLDSQGNASHALGQNDPDGRPTISDVLLHGAKLADALRPVADIPTLAVVPARRAEMEGIDARLAKLLGGEQRLRLALEADAAEDDTVWLLDCPGSLGLVTVSALVAAEKVVTVFAPMEKEAGGIAVFEGTVDQVRVAYNRRLRLAGVVPSIVPPGASAEEGARGGAGRYYRDVLRQVQDGWGDLVTPPVRRSVRVPESYSAQQPLILYAPEELVTGDIADVLDHLLKAGVIPAVR